MSAERGRRREMKAACKRFSPDWVGEDYDGMLEFLSEIGDRVINVVEAEDYGFVFYWEKEREPLTELPPFADPNYGRPW
jgi:hypothetical protein